VAETVAAVVVTYNRSKLLLGCLEALLRQTRALDKIILVDNASSDDTAEMLESRGYFAHPKIAYSRMHVNTGGAGGFHEGLKQAYSLGYDWLWIMDDDAEPYDDALERMSPSFGINGIAGVANLALGPDHLPQIEHRGWLDLNTSKLRAHRTLGDTALATNLPISFASFVGLAVHRSAIERIGLPMRELFIKGDDLEYCIRLATLGPLILVPDSKILHRDGASASLQRRRRFGYASNRIPLEKLWPSYFGFRNLLWMRRKYHGNRVAALFAARQYLRMIAGIMLFDSDRIVRVRFYWNAIADGWRGTFDNDKPRRLTRMAPRRKFAQV
jgi:GT2 family glycosyltransferase